MSATVVAAAAQTWPVDKDGFRLRGQEITRTETFTDAAFAFAVTLLVISVDAVPTTFDQMTAALRGVPAFALSFVMMMVFWHGHWQWSRRFGLEDVPTIMMSAMLVFTALVYVYPLKYVTGLLLWWVSGGRLGAAGAITGPEQLYGIFAVYGVGFSAMSLVIAALNIHAYRLRRTLQLNALESHDTKGEMGAWLILASVGMLSTSLALFTEFSLWVWPGWAYMVLPVVMPLYGARSGRARKRLLVEEQAAASPGH